MTSAASPKKNKAKRNSPFHWRGLTIQLVLVAILPVTVLLLLLTFGSLSLHQRAMRSLVGERDQHAVRTAAGAFNDQIRQRSNVLKLLARQVEPTRSQDLAAALKSIDFLESDFDLGMAVFDRDGALQAVAGEQGSPSTPFWQNAAVQVRQALQAGALQDTLILSDYSDPTTGDRAILILSAAPDGKRLAAGAFSTASLVRRVLDDALLTGLHTAYIVVDPQGRTVEQAGHVLADSNTPDHPGIAEALSGKSGTAYFPVGSTEHVIAYSPIPMLGWALLSEEPWEMVDTPTLRFTQAAPLVLAPVLLLALLALWFGARQVVRPLQLLEQRSSQLADGNFQAIAEPVGGISEIRQLQIELVNMARKVEAAQESLHGYIGAITAAQEDERRRLARELHDDTIQSLIALKQRLQLARLNLKDAPPTTPEALALDELTSLAEETIANVRRLTRGLRPIYLEDLGMVAAMEMLAQEASQSAGIPVEFRRLGAERRLDGAFELAFYRMAQEALNNIARHAVAARAELELEFAQQAIILTIRDDGIGFEVPKDPAEFARHGHFGLLGLYERAELIGAKLHIQSAPGAGTQLAITLLELK